MSDTFQLSRLATVDTRPYPILSLYLALDKSRDARLSSLNQLIKSKEQQINHNGLRQAWSDLEADREKVIRWVEELPMGSQRGLALFSCSVQDVFEQYTFPLALPDQLEVGPAPYIRPLAALAHDHGHTLVVVLDSRQARFFEWYMGELIERPELEIVTEASPQQRDGDQGRAGDSRLNRRADEALGRHFKEASATLLELAQGVGPRQVLVGGAKGVLDGFVEQLHPYLARSLGGTFVCEVTTSINKLSKEVARLQSLARRREQDRLLAQLANNLGPGGQAATGLNQVLAALHGGQVHTLFVKRGYLAPGGWCPGCGRLRHTAGSCPLCSQEMTPTTDVVNLAVARALESNASLEQVEGDSMLDELGSIAALLRYS